MTDRWPARPRPGTPCDTRTYYAAVVRYRTEPPCMSCGGDRGLRHRPGCFTPLDHNVGRCPRPATETLSTPKGGMFCWVCTECADQRVAQYGYRRNPKARKRRRVD